MKELLLSDEFKRYRKAQINEIVSLTRGMMMEKDISPDKIKGAMDMAIKMIRLPEKVVKGEENKKILRLLVEEDMNEFHIRYVRSHIMEE